MSRRKGEDMQIRNNLADIPVDRLYPHPDNPRKDLGDISELAESVKKNGIMQNLTVIPIDALTKSPEEQSDAHNISTMLSDFHVLIGHRRLAAAKEAGISKVPCKVISHISRNDQIAIMLEENIQRNDLTIYEQAQSFQLMLDLGETEDTLAEKTGFSKQTIKHRVELAKLDKDIFKEKSEDEGFQMTLKDMYMLEQIEDIEARNEVLKRCENSGQLQWKAANKIKEIEKERNKETIIKMLEEKGVKPAPERYQNERYSNKWNTVKDYLISEPPKIIRLPKSDEPYYFAISFNYIDVVQKVKKVKKELTEQEKKKKARDAAKKELNGINKKLDDDIREFVIGITDGKYTIPKVYESQLIKEVWGILIQFGYCSISISDMMCYISGKYLFDMTQEEKDQYREKIDKLTMLQQMIVCMARDLKNNCEIVTYDCICKENESKQYQDAVSILEGLGFSIDDTERKLIDGTHELYAKDGDTDETA